MAKRTAGMARTTTAWHIYHYQELFRAEGSNGSELEFVRYSKRHLTGWTAEAEQYCRQVAALRQTLGFAEFVMAKHIFEALLDMSQLHHQGDKYLRGYILDERQRPAGPTRIGQMIGCDAATAEKFLKILERVGLIDRCEVPASPGCGGGETVGSSAAKSTKKRVRKTVKKAAGGSKTRKKRQGGTQVEPPPPAFFKGEVEGKEESLRPSASAQDEDKNKLGLSASKGNVQDEGTAAAAPPRSDEGQAQAEGPAGAGLKPKAEEQAGLQAGSKRQGKGNVQDEGTAAAAPPRSAEGKDRAEGPASAGPESKAEEQAGLQAGSKSQGKGNAQAEPPTTPTTTPPIADRPTETDGGGAGVVLSAGSPPLDLSADERFERFMGAGSPTAFADEAYRRLRMPFAWGSPEACRECESFVSVYTSAVMQIRQPNRMKEFYAKAIKQADELGKRFLRRPKAFSKGSPAAVFNKKLKGLILKLKPG
jgi:hypothetical protein